MNEIPRQKLIELIQEYGRSLANEPKRCKAFLLDYCGEYTTEINVLINSLNEGIVQELKTSNSAPKPITLARLIGKLETNLAMAKEPARWAVETWALALQFVTESELQSFSPSNDNSNLESKTTEVRQPPQNFPSNRQNSMSTMATEVRQPPQNPPSNSNGKNLILTIIILAIGSFSAALALGAAAWFLINQSQPESSSNSEIEPSSSPNPTSTPTPSPTPTPTPVPPKPISLRGLWQGQYGLNNQQVSTLSITSQSGDSFQGTIETIGNRGNQFRLAIEGNINQNTREVVIQEVRLLYKSGGRWYLGKNQGTLSADRNQISGEGVDGKYKYTWYFTRIN